MNGFNITVLVATNHLDSIGGTEVYTYTLIEEFVKRNYDVEYFTFKKGFVSDKIEQLGVMFSSKKKYDLILANHFSCVEKLYKKGFIIQTCHGIYPLLEQPCFLSDAHVSISQEIYDYLISKGFNSKLILNGINLDRYNKTSEINLKIKKVLSLSQSDEANKLIKKVCEDKFIEFKCIDKYKNAIWDIEYEINKVDLVFGLGRSIYDAISCGRCVIIYDKRFYMDKGYGDGYVNENNIEDYIKNNCSGRYTNLVFGEKEIGEQIDFYRKEDGDKLRIYAEKHLSIVKVVDSYLEYFNEKNQNQRKFNKKIKNLFFLLGLKINALLNKIKSIVYIIITKSGIIRNPSNE